MGLLPDPSKPRNKWQKLITSSQCLLSSALLKEAYKTSSKVSTELKNQKQARKYREHEAAIWRGSIQTIFNFGFFPWTCLCRFEFTRDKKTAWQLCLSHLNILCETAGAVWLVGTSAWAFWISSDLFSSIGAATKLLLQNWPSSCSCWLSIRMQEEWGKGWGSMMAKYRFNQQTSTTKN